MWDRYKLLLVFSVSRMLLWARKCRGSKAHNAGSKRKEQSYFRPGCRGKSFKVRFTEMDLPDSFLQSLPLHLSSSCYLILTHLLGEPAASKSPAAVLKLDKDGVEIWLVRERVTFPKLVSYSLIQFVCSVLYGVSGFSYLYFLCFCSCAIFHPRPLQSRPPYWSKMAKPQAKKLILIKLLYTDRLAH